MAVTFSNTYNPTSAPFFFLNVTVHKNIAISEIRGRIANSRWFENFFFLKVPNHKVIGLSYLKLSRDPRDGRILRRYRQNVRYHKLHIVWDFQKHSGAISRSKSNKLYYWIFHENTVISKTGTPHGQTPNISKMLLLYFVNLSTLSNKPLYFEIVQHNK